MKTIKQISITLIACLSAVPALAATVSLVPSTTVVDSGDLFAVDLVLSAADAPGAHPGAFRGKVLVDFGSNASYSSFTYSAPAVAFGAETLDGTTIELGFDLANDVGVVGTFLFSSTGAAGDIITLDIEDAVPFIGSFFNTAPNVLSFTPTFVGTSVTTVPLPAAAWLMMGALGALGGVARRRA